MIDAAWSALGSPGLLAVIALVAMAAGRWRLARLALGGFTLLGVPTVASMLLTYLPMADVPTGTPMAIVVLPGDTPDLVNPGGEEPGGSTLERLRVAAALQRLTRLPILVTGGLAQDGRPAPATAMASSLETDFAATVRWTESGSHNLWQGTAASAALLRSNGIGQVYLVADRWDEALASRIYRRAGIEIAFAPVRRPNQMIFAGDALLLRAITWLESDWALVQWAGLACDAVRPCREWMAAPSSPAG